MYFRHFEKSKLDKIHFKSLKHVCKTKNSIHSTNLFEFTLKWVILTSFCFFFFFLQTLFVALIGMYFAYFVAAMVSIIVKRR